MKKKIYIFLIFIFGIIHIPLYSSNIYTYEVGSFYTSTDSVSLGNYVIDNYTLGELFGSSLQSANYKLNSGYLNYLDANYLPAYLKIYNDNKFVFSRNSFSNDTALLLVSDFDSEPVRYIKLDVEVVDKPIGATDDTFVIIETDKNGLASLNYRAGVLSGSYILKVSYFDVGSEYLCYSTNETVIPAKQWRMIGLNKISMNNTNVDFVFNNVKPEYIYRWNPLLDNDPINQRYEAVSEILSGQGYFTIFPEETVLTLSGSFFNDTYIQQLHPGWNQVASPYYYLVDWKNMKIQTTDNKILSVAAAETEGLIINKIFWFKDNVYYWGPNNEIPNPKLYVWTGFWVYARQSCRLLFVPGFSYTINDKINLAPRRIKGTVNDWQMLVSIKGNEISDLFNYIGVNANIDKLKKAPKFSNLLYAGLMNNNEVLCQDFRPPIQTAEEWHLTISNGNNTNITIEFPNIENVPDEYDIYLVNRADNSIYNLRENNAVNITQPKNRDRKYSIIVGYPEYVKALLRAPLSKDVSFAYPNPGPDVNDKVKFRCNNIDANGRLKIKIFDMAGRKVCERNVVLNNYPIGDYEWDCRNDAGKSVGSGVYIYIIEYISPIGESYKLIDKLGIIK